jgi:cytosine/adenosine deaminase-related metal-dependent hydrolase
MRLLTADILFTACGDPVRNGLIAVEEDGTILEVLDPQTEAGKRFLNSHALPPVEYYPGFICPGFINAHCHLELSHLKGVLTEKKGLMQFISEIVARRDEAGGKEKISAIMKAEAEMKANGIVAVGDICNTPDTIQVKRQSSLHWHNFIEVFDLDPVRADAVFEEGMKLAGRFMGSNGMENISITPHAPYSVSVDLLKKINSCAYENASLLTLHNQESAAEDLMFREGRGWLFDMMKKFGLPGDRGIPTGFTSLASTLIHLLRCNRILLVHNTYTSPADVDWAERYSSQVWWCLCPNANLFIENRLPDISMLAGNVSSRLLVGTDSYASNWSLSILDELKSISKHFPEIKLDEMIRWSTRNGAEFFSLRHLGTIEKGKKPGLNHLENVDVVHQSLTGETVVHPIVA